MEVGRLTWSDRLAVALACLAAVLALALLWMERTPIWAGVTIAGMLALIVYPVVHFAPSRKAGIPVLLVAWAVIGFFGWNIWPHRSAAANPLKPAATAAAPSTTIDQRATDSNCSNIAAGRDADVKCSPPEKPNDHSNHPAKP